MKQTYSPDWPSAIVQFEDHAELIRVHPDAFEDALNQAVARGGRVVSITGNFNRDKQKED